MKDKNKIEATRKEYYFLLLFPIEIFLVFFFRFLNMVCLDQIQKSHSFYEKKLQNFNKTTKKKFMMNVVQLWNSFLQKMCIFLFR